jgi:type III secretory pathway lipoprotein EscJ
MSLDDLAGLLPETDKQIEELHALLEFPAEEIAALLEQQAAEAEKVLPRTLTFVVTPEQEAVIEQAVELASDGTPGRDRKARGLMNLARRFLQESAEHG